MILIRVKLEDISDRIPRSLKEPIRKLKQLAVFSFIMYNMKSARIALPKHLKALPSKVTAVHRLKNTNYSKGRNTAEVFFILISEQGKCIFN